jgi:hypothetical protein
VTYPFGFWLVAACFWTTGCNDPNSFLTFSEAILR